MLFELFVGFCILLALIYLVLHIFSRLGKKYISQQDIARVLFEKKEYLNGFKRHLSLPTCVSKLICINETLSFSYTIPESLHSSLIQSPKQYNIGIGEYIAIADEVTTILTIAHDKTHRAGVSVMLSGQMCSNIPVTAGDTVEIEAKSTKLGATIGFSEMNVITLREGKQTRVAQIRHVKYLKMGIIWDIIGSSMPMFIRISRYFSPTIKDIAVTHQKKSDDGSDSKAELSLATSLNINRVIPSTGTSDDKGSNAHDFTSDSTSLSTSRPTSLVYSLTVHPGITNPFKSLHGGAVSTAVQHCLLRFCVECYGPIHSQRLSYLSQQEEEARWQVSSLEVQYLSPCVGTVQFTVEETGFDYCSGLGDSNQQHDMSTLYNLKVTVRKHSTSVSGALKSNKSIKFDRPLAVAAAIVKYSH